MNIHETLMVVFGAYFVVQVIREGVRGWREGWQEETERQERAAEFASGANQDKERES